MAEILLFGGTSECRELALLSQKRGVSTLVSVATEYGGALLETGGCVSVRFGKLDAPAMAALCRREAPRLVIDATHPYAIEAGCNIRAAATACSARYIRVKREQLREAGCLEFPDLSGLIAWLNVHPGTVFSTLGAKEAAALTQVPGFAQRIWLRILPSVEGLMDCLALGYPAQHIICMQGPFSRELNEAMFGAAEAAVLLTKESGWAGGFPDKVAAAQNCGMTIAVLGRPLEEEGYTLDELKQKIEGGSL